MKIDGIWITYAPVFYGRDLDFGAAPPPMPERELAKGRQSASWVGRWAYATPSAARQEEGARELTGLLCRQWALEIMMTSD